MLTPGAQRNWMLAAALCLAAALFLPLWGAVMTAPTYPERSLKVSVYAARMAGDLEEWGRVSKLVGVKLPPPIPGWTFKAVPAALAILGAIALAAAFFRGLRPLAALAPWAFFLAAGALTQALLYRVGHDLDPERPLRYFDAFTPPVVGWVKLGRIVTWHFPHLGSLLILAAALIPAWLWWQGRQAGAGVAA